MASVEAPARSAPQPPSAARIQGPSAFGGDWRRFWYLAYTLAITDFKLRFFGSVLGYLWQLVRPLMLFGVLYFVFTRAIKLGSNVPHFPVVLLTSIVLFTFFAESTGGAVTSVMDREVLVRKVQFPRLAIPVSVVMTAAFNAGLNLIVLLVFMLASGVYPRASWLELPVLLVLLAAWATGLATILSALYVRFRDVKPIWDVTTQVVFYATPIIYVIERIGSQQTRELMMLNPLAMVLQQARHALIDPGAAGAAGAAGGWDHLAIPLGLIAAVVGFGLWYFNRQAPSIAEEL